MRLAALPMYDFAELRPATDALWTAIAARLRARGVEAPDSLTRDAPLEALWTDPDLLLAQTCGYPLVTTLKGRVTLVATPCYRAPGCAGASYRSALVVRAGDPAAGLADLQGRSCAINDMASNSGMNLLRQAVRALTGGSPRFFFGETLITGAHAQSVRAVARGGADVAAIDCVTWAHLTHLRPAETAPLRVLAWTAPSPGLPLITALDTDAATRSALCRALDEVARDPALAAVRDQLRLVGFADLGIEGYEGIEGLLF
jgi:ABC-type phosphate/phosphonate transport system substrate-binding protein